MFKFPDHTNNIFKQFLKSNVYSKNWFKIISQCGQLLWNSTFEKEKLKQLHENCLQTIRFLFNVQSKPELIHSIEYIGVWWDCLRFVFSNFFFFLTFNLLCSHVIHLFCSFYLVPIE